MRHSLEFPLINLPTICSIIRGIPIEETQLLSYLFGCPNTFDVIYDIIIYQYMNMKHRFDFIKPD